MRRALALLALWAAACGGGSAAPIVSLGLSLSADTATKITELQVELVQSGSLDCGTASKSCLDTLGVTTVPFAGAQAGQQVYRAPFTATDNPALDLQVTPGTYLVNVEALDAAGNLVANGCQLGVDFEPSATTDVAIALAEYTGETCHAAM